MKSPSKSCLKPSSSSPSLPAAASSKPLPLSSESENICARLMAHVEGEPSRVYSAFKVCGFCESTQNPMVCAHVFLNYKYNDV
jgi:hypothetical protein